jgi:hypothetical protein
MNTQSRELARCGRPLRKARFAVPLLAGLAFAAAAALIAPRAFDAGWLLYAQDEPELLADRAVANTLDAQVAQREIEAALAADDPDLADSFLELARERGISLDPALVTRVAENHSAAARARRAAGSFARGLVTGEPQDGAGVAGMLAGDLFVFGDIRDAVREGTRLIAGEEPDHLILGLAAAGLAVTAGTYASLGGATPARAGLSLVKAAGRSGRITAPLAQWIGRSARGFVDGPAMRAALSRASLSHPALALRAVRDAVKIEKAGGLIDLVQDVGRVQRKAGTRAALDGLKIAESPKDVSRLARLSAAKGGKTRAILKLAGRGAFALTVGLFNLASWMFSALVSFFGFLCAVKSMTERATLRVLHWRKARRARRAGVRPAFAAGSALHRN